MAKTLSEFQANFRKKTYRHVIISYTINLLLQQPSLFILLHVLLTLQLRAGVQHHILDLTLHILCPGSQPGHSVIMLNLLPLVPMRWFWNFTVLGAVDDDILWHGSALDHSHLRVLASTAEKPGRLNSEYLSIRQCSNYTLNKAHNIIRAF